MRRLIPIELYTLIFHHITSAAELSNLCTVSRVFRHEAQRILYHTIHLSTDYDRIISWCHTIVENPRLAMQVYVLSLPTSFVCRLSLKGSLAFVRLHELQRLVKRALSSLSRLAKLHAYNSSGIRYLNFGIFCGHPFRLQVVEDHLISPRPIEPWLRFLSEQPGIRHWRPNILHGPTLDPDVLPLLTSAHVYSAALNVIANCPMIRALRTETWFPDRFQDELLMLKTFRRTLTSLSIGCYGPRLMALADLRIVRDAVPNIKFLGIPAYDILIPVGADILAELSGFPRLTTLIFELPPIDGSRVAWYPDLDDTLSLAADFMNANPTLRRVAFEMRGSWPNGRWSCYVRAQEGSEGGTAVFEAFDVLGPESWKDVLD